MTDPTLTTALRYAETHADPAGIAETPIPGFVIIRATHPSELQRSILQPVVCLVLQGSKRVMMGTDVYDFAEGDSLLITADVPTMSQITRANPATPYVSLALDLDPALIADLADRFPGIVIGDWMPGMLKTTMGIPDGLAPEAAAEWGAELALRADPELTGAVFEMDTEVLPPRGLKGKLKDALLMRRRRPRRLG